VQVPAVPTRLAVARIVSFPLRLRVTCRTSRYPAALARLVVRRIVLPFFVTVTRQRDPGDGVFEFILDFDLTVFRAKFEFRFDSVAALTSFDGVAVFGHR